MTTETLEPAEPLDAAGLRYWMEAYHDMWIADHNDLIRRGMRHDCVAGAALAGVDEEREASPNPWEAYASRGRFYLEPGEIKSQQGGGHNMAGVERTPSAAMVPHRCPVCDGRGLLSAGFYSQGASSGTTAWEACRSCTNGIVWASALVVPERMD